MTRLPALETPIEFANAFVCQFDQDLETFILTVGQLNPPALLGNTPEEIRAQIENLSYARAPRDAPQPQHPAHERADRDALREP